MAAVHWVLGALTAKRHRRTLAAAAALYGAALAFSPWIGPTALLGAAAAIAGLLAHGWIRLSSAAVPALSVGLWSVLHLVLLVTGGLASPLLPAVVPWIVLVASGGSFGRAVGAAGTAFVLLIGGELWVAAPSTGGVVEALVVAASGLGPAWLIDRLRRRTSHQVATLERILAEAETEGEGGVEAAAARRLDTIGRALDRVRYTLGSRRAVLWDVEAEGERARPWLASGGPAPPVVDLSGDPLYWAWEEGLPLQLESAPRWAGDAALACAVPLAPRSSHAALLTVEYGPDDDAPAPAELTDAAVHLHAFIRTQQQEARAAASRQHFARALQLLKGLPQDDDPAAFARDLADSTRSLAGGTGALVATWSDGQGQVLALVGDDGGPAVGMELGGAESECAVVARTGARIVREDRRRGRGSLPLAAPEERWHAEPRALVVLPLTDADGAVVGLLAAWSSHERTLDAHAIDVLDAVRPYAGMQLRQRQTYANLRRTVGSDSVTALPNRRAFEQRLRSETSRFDRYRRPLALLMLDIDHFKSINDTWGHDAGDAVLRSIAEMIRATIREADYPARYGGEEFAVLLPETRLREARDAAERLRRTIETTRVGWNGEELAVRASVGVSACPECVEHPTEMLTSADAMLYESKAGGRNRVTVAARVGD